MTACWLLTTSVAWAQDTGGAPTDQQIERAVETLKTDPNLAQERKAKTLRFRSDAEKKPDTPRERSTFANWVSSFFSWVGGLSRALVWVILGVLGLMLLGFLLRLLSDLKKDKLPKLAPATTHVRDLDIRPESLPDDIGAAALELWQRGDHRGALALLYRGLLSRLVHSFQVPVSDSTTEGDCLELAAKHLQAERRAYVAQLIRTWQRATYGGRDAQTEEVQALCANFATALAPIPERQP
jgi:hypothetical protein